VSEHRSIAFVSQIYQSTDYNPRYYDEPEKYKPSRWYKSDSRELSDSFTAFSTGRFFSYLNLGTRRLTSSNIGPRECPGRKFANMEAVSFLTLILRDWKLEPLMRPGETLESWKKRVFEARLFMTLGLENTPVRFVRRG